LARPSGLVRQPEPGVAVELIERIDPRVNWRQLQARTTPQHQRPVRHLSLGLGFATSRYFNGNIALIAPEGFTVGNAARRRAG
jgi:hypothetical protein